MKKILLLGLALGIAFSFSSCNSSKNSAYKAAYDQAKQQELEQGQGQATDAIEITPVSSTTVESDRYDAAIEKQPVDDSYREEKVVVAAGEQGALKAFSIVCGSFKSKTNAEALRSRLVTDGYSAFVVQNPATGMYRVVCASYDDRQKAAEARAQFKACYPNDTDFQKAWLLYNK